MDTSMETKRISNSKIIGYSVGTVGEYFVYFLFFNYFLYFLTDFVGIAPYIAGIILSIAMIWDAFTDPVVGYISDNSQNPKGRRRPIMIKAIVPFAITFALCFVRINWAPGLPLYAYYTIVALAFWLCFTLEQVPFYGIAPEMSHNSDDRLVIRQMYALMGNLGNIAIGLVPFALEVLPKLGVNEDLSWTVTMGFLGTIGALSFVVAIIATKGMETPPEKVMMKQKMNLFQTYASVIKLKGNMIIVGIYFLSTIFINLIFASIMYVGSEKLMLSGGQLSIVMWAYTISGLLFIPLVGWLAKAFGIHKAFKLYIIITAILYFALGLIGINSFTIMLVHGIVTGGAFVVFTAYTYICFYEITDLAFFKTGNQLEGSVISFATFGYKLGAAAGGLILGVSLSIIGYDGTLVEQAPEVMEKLDNLLTFIPTVLILVILGLFVIYPIKNKEATAMREAMALVEQGKEYSTKGFENLLS